MKKWTVWAVFLAVVSLSWVWTANVPAQAATLRTFSTVGTPSISGTIKSGSTAYANVGSWYPTPTTVYYQWYRNGSPITGQTGRSYRLTDADVGKELTVWIAGSRPDYQKTQRQSAGRIVQSGPSRDYMSLTQWGSLYGCTVAPVWSSTLVGASGLTSYNNSPAYVKQVRIRTGMPLWLSHSTTAHECSHTRQIALAARNGMSVSALGSRLATKFGGSYVDGLERSADATDYLMTGNSSPLQWQSSFTSTQLAAAQSVLAGRLP